MYDNDRFYRDFHAWALMEARNLRVAVETQNYDIIEFKRFSDEMAGIASSQRQNVLENLGAAMRNIIRIACIPNSDKIMPLKLVWLKEINAFLDTANDRYSHSMRQYILLNVIWRKTCKRVLRDMSLDGWILPELPDTCPFELDDLINEDFDAYGLIGVLSAAMNEKRK